MSSTKNHQAFHLTKWLRTQQPDQFPPDAGRPYLSRFDDVAQYLNKNVHRDVGTGAALKGSGILTDHGPRHIQTVIDRASALLARPDDSSPELTPYEVYLLLQAIHFHDVGNIFGRHQHESMHTEVMDKLSILIGEDSVEKRAILKISQAHGGMLNGSKDTISRLPKVDPVLCQDVRYQALAAILRFCDELADDLHRAKRMLARLDLIPKPNQIFHAYAKSLHSVQIRPEHHLVELHYMFDKSDAICKFRKPIDKDNSTTVYLLDEIFTRTIKTHLERIYCMRFMYDIARIDAIDVKIEVYLHRRSVEPCVPPIGYRLEEIGYPETSNSSIRDLCPNIPFSGETLRKTLE